jgi:hypothetical protein
MTEQERLTELIDETGMVESKSRCSIIASELLGNGVIVPPVRLGQIFYHIEEYKHNILPDKYPTVEIECTSNVEFINIGKFDNEFGDARNSFNFKDIGKTVFLAKEEVEQALKEGEPNA